MAQSETCLPKLDRQGVLSKIAVHRPQCDNMAEMNWHIRVVLVAALSIVALGFAILTAYLLSTLLLGEWKYTELFLPTATALLASLFAAIGASFVLRRQAGVASIVRTAALLIAACGTLAGGIYFGLLANCGLSCGETVESE